MQTGGDFRPAWWLPGGHLQTLFPTLFRVRRPPSLKRERLELEDGDFLDLDWTREQPGPLVLLLHGLEGSLHSHYVSGLLGALDCSGRSCVQMYFRGCSGEPNRLPRSYHSGETGDLQTVLDHISQRYPGRDIYAAGVSLGGNVLLKWLGENPQQGQVQRALAISVPFDLANAATRLERGISRIYQAYLLRKLRRSLRNKARHVDMPMDVDHLSRLSSFRRFDDEITAPLHGFNGVDDYYKKSSSRGFVPHILTPTLIIHALDDPFMNPDAIPRDDELGPGVTLELYRTGGHVGFVSGWLPLRPRYWLDQRVSTYFASPNCR
ncbi:Hydrolase, alpha/beta fold family functionally coupled to Phosphoribulokinase [hydrothermal vent metagenome]|uniref:Hydrolase, alpha/beta fold family functionally coupled to Phosphoribulokinase n=1 Tax=hydrothermal vent metagenome TaxID=652676 RepID=A0A3B0ZPE7_9ZZZZ